MGKDAVLGRRYCITLCGVTANILSSRVSNACPKPQHRDVYQQRRTLKRNTKSVLKIAETGGVAVDDFPAMSSYSPDESPSQLLNERTWLLGAEFSAMAYGVILTIFVMCFDILLSDIRRSYTLKKFLFLAYIVVMFSFATVYEAIQAIQTQSAFIDNRNYPGGPAQYELSGIPLTAVSSLVNVLVSWLADGLLIWRCAVIYAGCKIFVRIVIFIPCLLLVATIVIDLIEYIKTFRVGSETLRDEFFPSVATSITTFSLNVIVTILIVGRLILFRRRVVKALGSEEGTLYMTIASMLIESATLYSIVCLLLLVSFPFRSPVQNLNYQSICQVQIVSTFLIIFRVAQGKGWSSDGERRAAQREAHLTSLHFAISHTSSAVVPSSFTPPKGDVQRSLEV